MICRKRLYTVIIMSGWLVAMSHSGCTPSGVQVRLKDLPEPGIRIDQNRSNPERRTRPARNKYRGPIIDAHTGMTNPNNIELQIGKWGNSLGVRLPKHITGNHELPEPVQALLEGWGQFMSLTYLKHGEQSSEWLMAQSVAEDLVWSVCPDHRVPDARSKLLKLIPRLLKSVRAGLSEVSYDSFKSKELLKSLEGLHVNSLQLLAPKPVVEKVVVEKALVEKAVVEKALVEKAIVEKAIVEKTIVEKTVVDKIVVEPSISEEPVNSSSMLSDMDLALDDVDSILDGITDAQEAIDIVSTADSFENIVPVEDLVKPVDAVVTTEVSEESIKMVDSLRVGSWLDFHGDGTTIRCKLAALIRVTDKYIFVDRSGIKVAEKNQNVLLEMAQAGEISMINDGLLFDRALESVIGNLRESRKD